MNPYVTLGSRLGTNEAAALSARLREWHDAMVAHQRSLAARTGARCDDECPHAEAGPLWHEAVETFGDAAHQLTFLRACATGERRRAAS